MSKAKETHGLQDFGFEGKEFGIPLVLQGFMIQTHIPDSHLSINGELYKGFLSIPGIGKQGLDLDTNPPTFTKRNQRNHQTPLSSTKPTSMVSGICSPTSQLHRRMLGATCGNHFGRSFAGDGARTSRGELDRTGVLASIPLLDHRCREKSSFNSVYSFQVVYVVHQHYDFSKESKSNPTLNQILLYQPPFCNWVSQFHPSKNGHGHSRFHPATGSHGTLRTHRRSTVSSHGTGTLAKGLK